MTTPRHVLFAELAAYKQTIDADITAYCQQLLSETKQQFTPFSHQALAAYCSVLQRGGKRLRGALVIAAYKMMGGQNAAMITQAARVVEMLHAYMLIVDDVCDRSATRRGGPTAHIMLADYHKTQHLHGDSAHFGVATAINAALAGNHLAQVQLCDLPVSDDIKATALAALNQGLATTTHGQLNDLFNEALQNVPESAVLKMLSWKTAYYSVLNPLQLGALLAGAPLKNLQPLHDYAMHLGLAFQITDDILGTFGNEFESGKSAQDDLKEGKITVLVSYALAHATPAQKTTLLQCLGNSALTNQQHKTCQTILTQTGALQYATQLAATHAHQAAAALQHVPQSWQPAQVQFLRNLAAFVTTRHT